MSEAAPEPRQKPPSLGKSLTLPKAGRSRGSLVDRRSLQRTHKGHLERLARVKTQVDNAPPPT